MGTNSLLMTTQQCWWIVRVAHETLKGQNPEAKVLFYFFDWNRIPDEPIIIIIIKFCIQVHCQKQRIKFWIKNMLIKFSIYAYCLWSKKNFFSVYEYTYLFDLLHNKLIYRCDCKLFFRRCIGWGKNCRAQNLERK